MLVLLIYFKVNTYEKDLSYNQDLIPNQAADYNTRNETDRLFEPSSIGEYANTLSNDTREHNSSLQHDRGMATNYTTHNGNVRDSTTTGSLWEVEEPAIEDVDDYFISIPEQVIATLGIVEIHSKKVNKSVYN